MTKERTQANRRQCARQWYLAGKHLSGALVVTLMLAFRSIRVVAHFALVPYSWVPSRWQRSPLSEASARLAHASVDTALVVLPIGIAAVLLF